MKNLESLASTFVSKDGSITDRDYQSTGFRLRADGAIMNDRTYSSLPAAQVNGQGMVCDGYGSWTGLSLNNGKISRGY